MDKCKECSEYILENNGLPEDAPPQIREHAESCPECRLKIELFKTGKEQISLPAYQIESSLLRARETAQIIIKRKKDILSFVLFILTALTVSTVIASAGKLGIVIPVLLVQGLMIFMMPVLFLLFFVKSRQKEAQNER